MDKNLPLEAEKQVQFNANIGPNKKKKNCKLPQEVPKGKYVSSYFLSLEL